MPLTLGFVFGDDFYAYLEARSKPDHAAEMTRTVRRLIVADRQQLGIRRRRYLFQPPAWPGISLGRAITHYLAPRYPSNPTRITVFPAVPLAGDVAPAIDLQRALGEDLLVTEAGPSSGLSIRNRAAREISVASGLAGTRWDIKGTWGVFADVEREIVLLRDAHYGYVLELVTDRRHGEAARPTFERVVDSVRPIPLPSSRAASGEAFSHWAE